MPEPKDVISLVVPAYNEQESLKAFYAEAVGAIDQMPDVDVEFVFVNDGSSDATLSVIKELRKEDPRVRYVSFSRNFGKEPAIYAGLQHATGDYVALMDADLQDPPSLLPQMYDLVTKQGYDCAATRRSTREGESKIRSYLAERFYSVFNRLSGTQLVSGARDYRLMTRQMVDAILQLQEANRFSKGLFSWVGFDTAWIEYENVERIAGTTKWSFFDLLRYSVEGIVDFSAVPLQFASAVGFLFTVLAFAEAVHIIIKTLVFSNPVPGWPSLATIVLFASGVQLFSIGILGQYLARTYVEVKRRPVYMVKETEESPSRAA